MEMVIRVPDSLPDALQETPDICFDQYVFNARDY